MNKLRKERRSEWKQSWFESRLNSDYDHSYYGASIYGASIFEGSNRNEKRANWRKSWEGFKVK